MQKKTEICYYQNFMSNKLSETHLVFSTPIWTSMIDSHKEVNDKMFAYIKSLQSLNPLGKTKSNLFGWHSDYFDLNDFQTQFDNNG